MKRVVVLWQDSNTLHGWQYGDVPTDLADCETLGYLTDEDEEKLVLSQTISTQGAHMGVTIIARGCVKSVRELRIK